MKEKNLELFLELSVHLTGFKRIELLGTGLVIAYHQILTERTGKQASDLMLSAFENIMKTHGDSEKAMEQAIREKIMSHTMFGPMARCMIKLWYLGQWEALPGHWRSIFGNFMSDVNEIISPESYKEGLVWRAIKAHPMGAKQPGFDSWSGPPEAPED